ncbi:Sec-independent protein translocase protein TatB [Aquamicrobium segne]|uniref:Sec-independent protein translocase protein TatB n=1 Tax=Aquamicrobium segne TaxID=469547 RepID=A0ABW0GZN1_9HYPH
MLDVGWSEMLVIAIVMIVVVGPKDLPQMLRSFGRMTAKMRGMANDFQKQFNDALKEAELDEVKKSVDTLRNLNPAAEIRKQLNPFEKAASDVKASLEDVAKPKVTPEKTALSAGTDSVKSDATPSTSVETIKSPAGSEVEKLPKTAKPVVAKTRKTAAARTKPVMAKSAQVKPAQAKSVTAKPATATKTAAAGKAGNKVAATAAKTTKKAASPAKTAAPKPSAAKPKAAPIKAAPIETTEAAPAAARPRRPATVRKTTRTPK